MNKKKKLNRIRMRRKLRARARVFGTAYRPRLSVFRSNRHIFLQLIDDTVGKTLVSASTQELKGVEKNKAKINQAELAAELLFKRAEEQGITKAVFDRGFYKYHGRVKSVAETLRKKGMTI
jgi:large subunit ribosomal protein L18